MSDRNRCPICDTTTQEVGSDDGDNRILWDCARCGKYWFFGSGRSPVQNNDPEGRARISGFVYDQNRIGLEPELTRESLEQMMSRPLPSVGERAERLLTEVVQCQKKLGDHVDVYISEWIAATYSLVEYELEFLVRMLSERRFIKLLSEAGECEILPVGHIEADEINRKIAQSDKGFVPMWFDSCLIPVTVLTGMMASKTVTPDSTLNVCASAARPIWRTPSAVSSPSLHADESELASASRSEWAGVTQAPFGVRD